jgi:hypothetical protein
LRDPSARSASLGMTTDRGRWPRATASTFAFRAFALNFPA